MTFIGIAAALAATAIAASALAQASQTQSQPEPQAQSPAAPSGSMMGRGPGGGMGWGAHGAEGWAMMTPAERQAHMTKMHSFTSRADCQAYVAQHHQLMVERAKQRGLAMPSEPRRDPCIGLK